MNPHIVFVFVAIVLPFAAAYYGQAQYGGSSGVEEMINAASSRNYQSAHPHVLNAGNTNVYAPNAMGQPALRSMVMPNNLNNHQLITTQRMQPIYVNQPGSAPAYINSGPATVVRAAPVVYKLKPSIIYQQQIIEKTPPAVKLNPMYVKLYQPGASAPANGAAYGGAPVSQYAGYGAQPGY